MNTKEYISVYDLEGRALEAFIDKYGDIYEPRFVDFDYYKMYYLGKYDPMRLIFEQISKTYEVNRVLYPGSFVHITPSFAFKNVTYVDVYDGIKNFFTDQDVLKYIQLHKKYDCDPQITFLHQSYFSCEGTYDFMISSNAGSISIDCKDRLSVGGLLLVNNGHSDADNAFADEAYEYLGYYKYNVNKDRVTFVVDGTSKKSNDYYLFRKVS